MIRLPVRELSDPQISMNNGCERAFRSGRDNYGAGGGRQGGLEVFKRDS